MCRRLSSSGCDGPPGSRPRCVTEMRVALFYVIVFVDCKMIEWGRERMIIPFGLDIRSADDGEQTLEVRMRTHPPSESQICFGAIYQHIEMHV